MAEARDRSIPPPGGEQRGAYSLNAGRPAPLGSGPAPDRLSRRLLQVAGGLAVLLLAVIANHALQSEENPFNPIAKAAERTQRASGGRVIMDVLYSSPGVSPPVVATGGGVYNERTGRARFSLRIPSPEIGELTVSAVGDERTIYLSAEIFAGKLPGGREWMAVQPLLGRSQTAVLAGNGGAREGLQLIEAVGEDVELLGGEDVRGVPTERYRGSVDLAAFSHLLAAEGKAGIARHYEAVAREIPAPVAVEVWIDERDMVRRMRQVMTMPGSDGAPEMTIDTRMDLVDLGIEPKIHLPARRDVFDMTPVVRAEMGLFDGGAFGPLAPPAGAPSLSALALRRRGNAICASLFDRADPILARAEGRGREFERLGENRDLEGLRRAARVYAYDVLEPLVRLYRGALRRLARLAPPPDQAAAYESFLRASYRGGEIVEAMARAFELGDLKLADPLEEQSDAASEDSDGYARQLGLDSCIGDGEE